MALAQRGWKRHPFGGCTKLDLDEATFAKAWAEGRALTLEQAVEYALIELFVSYSVRSYLPSLTNRYDQYVRPSFIAVVSSPHDYSHSPGRAEYCVHQIQGQS